MFGSAMLETMIGIVFVFLVMSTVVSSLSEQFATNVALRARVLRLLIERLLGGAGTDFVGVTAYQKFRLLFSGFFRRLLFGMDRAKVYHEFEDHPLIHSLKKANGSFPTFIPPDTFAKVVVDILIEDKARNAVTGAEAALTADQEMTYLRQTFAAPSIPLCLSDGTFKNLRLMFHRAQSSVPDGSPQIAKKRLQAFEKALAEWFDRGGDRSTGWYKKAINRANVILAFLLVIGINIDSLALIDTIYKQPMTRQTLVESAERVEDQEDRASGSLRTQVAAVQEDLSELEQAGLPIGWTKRLQLERVTSPGDLTFTQFMMMLLGWLITIFAISLGAPFWFDLLNKLVNLRNAGKQQAKP